MRIYGASEAAVEIGVEPRALRRYLRGNPSYSNAGIGGRYMFTEEQVRQLHRQLKDISTKPVRHLKEVAQEWGDDDKGSEAYLLAWGNPAALAHIREERREARAARTQRLRERMHEVLPERYDDEDFVTYCERVGW